MANKFMRTGETVTIDYGGPNLVHTLNQVRTSFNATSGQAGERMDRMLDDLRGQINPADRIDPRTVWIDYDPDQDRFFVVLVNNRSCPFRTPRWAHRPEHQMTAAELDAPWDDPNGWQPQSEEKP